MTKETLEAMVIIPTAYMVKLGYQLVFGISVMSFMAFRH